MLRPRVARLLPRSGRNVAYCAVGFGGSVAEMQAPARGGLFFCAVTHPHVDWRSVLRRRLDLFPAVIEREFGSGALERLDDGELGVERLPFLGISSLGFRSP